MRKTKFTDFSQTTQVCSTWTDVSQKTGTVSMKKVYRKYLLPVFILCGFWSQSLVAQCALVCNDDVNISLPGTDENCELEITIDMLLEDPTSCPGALQVTVMNSIGQVIPTNPIIDESYIGQTLFYEVSEVQPGGNSCSGSMDIEDKLPPEIANCGDFNIYCLLDNKPTIDGGDAPSPTFADCSGAVTWSYFDTTVDGICSDNYTQIITREWTATDQYGNISTCSQTVTVDRVSLNQFTPNCPSAVTEICDPNGTINTDPAVTGYPTIDLGGGNVVDIIPGANNTCSVGSSFQDEEFDLCGGGQKILRTWTVYDWCLPTQVGLNPISCIQVIEVKDLTPPSIICQSNLVVSAASSACAATVILPPATVSDECSGWSVKIITPFGQVDGNGGILPNVPAGTYNLLYVATDDCGNDTNCPMTLEVVDNTPPVAICDEFTIVSLADSMAIVSASIFDDGSTDNCGIDRFEVRRIENDCQPDGTNFGPYVPFDCCDISQNVMIALRVFDNSGNSNICMIEVEVQDKLDPSILCPADKVVECGMPIPAVQDPLVYDNCDGVTWVVDIDDELTSCGTGQITRSYTATDAQGRTANCVQKITLVNNSPFDGTGIIWPDDYYTTECGASLDIDDLDAPYQEPLTNESTCDLIAVTNTDQPLPTNDPACYKVLRKWIVIDWCQFDPNVPNSPGYWEHTQILRVEDVIDPILTCPTDMVIASLDTACTSEIVVLNAVTVLDCSNSFEFNYTIDLFSDGTNDAFGNTANASGTYPFGMHEVAFEVNDKCGNTSYCDFTITVEDGKKPKPVCKNGLAVELMAHPNGGGMIEIQAEFFDSGSSDNCTAQDDLEFSISPSIFDCDDIGTQIVTFTVTDEAGNFDFCETYVIIQDNMVVCNDPQNSANVAGVINTEMGEGIEEVMIEVGGNGPATIPVLTNDFGDYQFPNLATGNDYTFTPTNDLYPLNGVTTIDLVHITRHILQVNPLDSPYKIIAADINHTNTVTTMDVVELRRMILQINSSFPNNKSWRFVDKDYVFPNPNDPFNPPFPEFQNINNLNNDDLEVDFIGVKVGDVNNSATANLMSADDRDADTDGILSLEVENRGLKAGETYHIDFMANDFKNILGFQFTLDFDETLLDFVGVMPKELNNMTEDNFGYRLLDEGILTTSWHSPSNVLLEDGTPLFSLTFVAKEATSIDKAISISSQYTKAEAYKAGEVTSFLEVQLRFTNDSNGWSHTSPFKVYQNRPNPFRSETIIAWEMPEAGWSRLTITDISGKILKTITNDYPKGYNQLTIRKEELQGSQMMFFKVENICEVVIKKMVALE